LNIVYRFRFPILAATVVVFVAVWWVVALRLNNAQQVAGPMDTAKAFSQIYSNTDIRKAFFGALGTTMLSIFEGFALAVVVGIPMGIIMGRYVLADYMLDPWVNAWYSIPAVAFVPLTMSYFGLTSTSAMWVGFLVAVFSIAINVYTGVKNVSNSLVEPALSFGSTQTNLFTKVILPAALPNIMVGLRLGISRAIDGVIIAEMIFQVVGLGGLIFISADNLQLYFANALIIVLAIISIALNEAMKFLNRKAVAWKESAAMIRQ
jgi:NitT/TauT family transport system permease protein